MDSNNNTNTYGTKEERDAASAADFAKADRRLRQTREQCRGESRRDSAANTMGTPSVLDQSDLAD